MWCRSLLILRHLHWIWIIIKSHFNHLVFNLY
nr:MAG TPA: hypothetical protein [Caudoviricetes sp.]